MRLGTGHPVQPSLPAYCETGRPVLTRTCGLAALARVLFERGSGSLDATIDQFRCTEQLYERYYSGDPVRLAGTLYGLYDKDTHIDRIFGLLDDLEAQKWVGATAFTADRAP